jgi:hypothetical protein
LRLALQATGQMVERHPHGRPGPLRQQSVRRHTRPFT